MASLYAIHTALAVFSVQKGKLFLIQIPVQIVVSTVGNDDDDVLSGILRAACDDACCP